MSKTQQERREFWRQTNRSVAAAAGVEVISTTGERLRIASGADAATVRLALSVLREPR
jgi:hypothetical protein